MPGMGGEELAEIGVTLRPGIRVVFTSGFQTPPGNAAFVPKPYRAVDLIRVLPPQPGIQTARRPGVEAGFGHDPNTTWLQRPRYPPGPPAKMEAGQGIELRFRSSERRVLPLNEPAKTGAQRRDRTLVDRLQGGCTAIVLTGLGWSTGIEPVMTRSQRAVFTSSPRPPSNWSAARGSHPDLLFLQTGTRTSWLAARIGEGGWSCTNVAGFGDRSPGCWTTPPYWLASPGIEPGSFPLNRRAQSP